MLSLIVLAVMAPRTLSAQTSVQIPLQFDFINPGAKSLALGGAFIAVADDATAGFANPAGLRELNRPEVSLELRGRGLESEFLERGRLSGPVERQGTDTIAGPQFGVSKDPQAGIAYAAAVYASPLRRWAVAAFRHEVARVDQEFQSNGVFQKDPSEFTSRREPPQAGSREISITSYAAAGAVEINSRLAAGATLNVYTFELDSAFRRFDTDGFFGEPVLSREIARATQTGEGVSVAPTLGLRGCLKRCDDRATTSMRWGAVYRHGPSFDLNTETPTGARSGAFRVPHVMAFGAAVELPNQTGRRMLAVVDVSWIGYSRLLEDFVFDQARPVGVEDNLYIDDGVEVHAGFQYSPSPEQSRWLPKYRVGVWVDPDHSVGYQVLEAGTSAEVRTRDEWLTTALATSGSAVHVSGGLGLTFSSRFDWNAGIDVSSRSTTFSTSLIVKLRE